MSTLSELTRKADYIASRNHQLKSQWHCYQNSLIQAVKSLNKKINHEFIGGVDDDLRFELFNHFTIRIQLSDDFFSHEITYSLNVAPAGEAPRFTPFAHATLSEQGCIDQIPVRDKAAVLDHYLNKIFAIYQCLFEALQADKPIYTQLEKWLVPTAVR